MQTQTIAVLAANKARLQSESAPIVFPKKRKSSSCSVGVALAFNFSIASFFRVSLPASSDFHLATSSSAFFAVATSSAASCLCRALTSAICPSSSCWIPNLLLAPCCRCSFSAGQDHLAAYLTPDTIALLATIHSLKQTLVPRKSQSGQWACSPSCSFRAS